MRRVLALVLAVVLLLGCTGCNQKTKAQTELWAMDTYMTLQLWGKDAEAASDAVQTLIAQLEETWDATDGNSVIGRLNRGETVTLTQEQQAFLDEVEKLSRRTGGAFDPKLRAVSVLWGFPGGNGRVPGEDEIRAALEQEQWDLGAAVKGYAGQQAVQLLEDMDVTHALLNLGGNVQTYGEKPDGTPWQIGIQDPNGGDPLGIVSVEGTMAVVTSGDYQRYFELDGIRYHHLLDPETGYPVESEFASVTVICENGLWADVMSTALYVMDPSDATDFWREKEWFEAVFVMKNGEIYATEGVVISDCAYGVIRRDQ